MTEPLTSLKVFYNDNGKNASRTLKFKGNFGFNLDGKKYEARDGHVYNSNGKPVEGLKMEKALAYQFIGMSNTAELAQDYTYSEKDMNDAKTYFSGYNNNNTRINSIVGEAVTKDFKNGGAKYKNGIYTTDYKHTVSVWQIK